VCGHHHAGQKIILFIIYIYIMYVNFFFSLQVFNIDFVHLLYLLQIPETLAHEGAKVIF
jgi:hypothetical protein